MVDATLHDELRGAEFRQGDVIEPVETTVVYDPARVASALARAHRDRSESGQWKAFATGYLGRTVGAVIISHDCDLDRSPAVTPLFEVMRVLEPNSDFSERVRGGIRFFVLSEEPRLVIEAQARAWVDKGALLGLARVHRPDPATLIRFQSWLSQQYERPAFPQDVVDNVCRPIGEAIKRHQTTAGTTDFYERLRSIAIRPLAEAPHYRVDILITLVGVAGLETIAAGLVAEIANDLRASGRAEVASWRLVQPETITLRDYEDHAVVFADDP